MKKSKPHLAPPPTPSLSGANASLQEEADDGTVVSCSVWPKENIHDYINQMEEEKHINLFKFRFLFHNQSYDVSHGPAELGVGVRGRG